MDPIDVGNKFEESSEVNASSENPAVRYTYTCHDCGRIYKTRHAIKKHVRLKGHFGVPGANAKTTLPVSLPQEWNWTVAASKPDIYTILIRMENFEEIKRWMSKFMAVNHCKYVIRNSVSSSDVKRLLYRCEQYQKPTRPTSRKHKIKGTDCPCKVVIRFARNIAEIRLTNLTHNHSLKSPAILRFYSPSEKLRHVFEEMFENGATPAEALKNFKNHLEQNCRSDEEFLLNCADRCKTPDYDWVRHFYYRTFVKKYGSTKVDHLVADLLNVIETTNANAAETVCQFEQIDADNFVIVVVTSLMRRVLATSAAGEIMFVDSCGSVDKFGLRLFLLATKSGAGRAPEAVLITTSETVPALTQALLLFASSIPPSSFGGRGNLGPLYIVTDNSSSQIAALQSVFPASRHFLCIFHVLKCVYRWLNDADHKVNRADRDVIYNRVRRMVYSQNAEELGEIFSKLLGDTENPAVRKYVTTLYQRKEKWALCFRQDPLLRHSSANDAAERGVRVLKETILKHIKAQSPSQLVDFIVTDYTDFYKQKLLTAALSTHNRTHASVKKSMVDYVVTKSSDCDSIFTVFNAVKNVVYKVNSDVGVCSCFVGASGNLCKHQLLLEVDQPQSCFSPSAELQLYFLATGSTDVPELYFLAAGSPDISDSFYEPLNHASYSQAIVQVEHDLTDNDYDIIEETVYPHEEAIIEESVSHRDNEAEDEALALLQEVKELHTNWVDLMKKNPAQYVEGLRSYAKELESIVHTPSKSTSALYSFNTNAECSPKSGMQSTKRMGADAAAVQRRKNEVTCKGSKNSNRWKKPVYVENADHTYGQS